jgi:hypothetical protein
VKKKLLILLLLLMVVSPAVFGSQPEKKDRCTEWIGPYGGGVYYRYVQSYLGQDTWSPDYDCYQFMNKNSYQVAITWYTTKDNKTYGPYSSEVNGNTVGELIALSGRERLSSITVK